MNNIGYVFAVCLFVSISWFRFTLRERLKIPTPGWPWRNGWNDPLGTIITGFVLMTPLLWPAYIVILALFDIFFLSFNEQSVNLSQKYEDIILWLIVFWWSLIMSFIAWIWNCLNYAFPGFTIGIATGLYTYNGYTGTPFDHIFDLNRFFVEFLGLDSVFPFNLYLTLNIVFVLSVLSFVIPLVSNQVKA